MSGIILQSRSVVPSLGEDPMRRRELIKLIAGGAAAWPVAARAQQSTMPVVGLVSGRSAQDAGRYTAAFRKGLNESGYVEGQNVMVEYHWLDGQYDRLPSLNADLVRRRVAIIATRRWAFGIDRRPFARPGRARLIGSARANETTWSCSTKNIFGAFFRNTPATIMRCGRTFRSARTHPAHARSSDSETLSRSRSLVGYTIDSG